jgi:hypothetical protein
MRRRDFIKGVVGSTAWSFAALAQQTVRLGYLVGEAREDPAAQNLRRQFVLGMRDLGYIEGRNYVMEERYAAGQMDRFASYAQGLVDLPVDVIVAGGEAAIRAAKRARWREGANLVIGYRYSEQMRRDAAELVGLKPDVIWTSGGLGLLSLKRATHSIPIVFTTVYDPVGSGYVASLARPGGNITGFTLASSLWAGRCWRCSRKWCPRSVVWRSF